MSCLFDSLSTFVPGLSGSDLRQKIVEYLKTNPLMIDEISFESMMKWEGSDNESAEDYLEKMGRSDEWGGGIEIRAFCQLYNCRVDVHIPLIGRMVEFYPDVENNETKNKCSILWTGNHFVPLGNRTPIQI